MHFNIKLSCFRIPIAYLSYLTGGRNDFKVTILLDLSAVCLNGDHITDLAADHIINFIFILAITHDKFVIFTEPKTLFNLILSLCSKEATFNWISCFGIYMPYVSSYIIDTGGIHMICLSIKFCFL